MGGFAVNEEDILPSGCGARPILTCDGIQALFSINPEIVPHLSEPEIQDKSTSMVAVLPAYLLGLSYMSFGHRTHMYIMLVISYNDLKVIANHTSYLISGTRTSNTSWSVNNSKCVLKLLFKHQSILKEC
jgi:hypothetical protein